jgi:hypothetical protein
MPPPEPPRVNDGRRMHGKPMSSTTARAASTEPTTVERGQARPIRVIACLNSSRSSAISMAWTEAPISRVPCLARTPALWASSARLRPVWPPRVGKIASGFSTARI